MGNLDEPGFVFEEKYNKKKVADHKEDGYRICFTNMDSCYSVIYSNLGLVGRQWRG